MSEDNAKKDLGVTVRVPEWLADALEEELQLRPRPRPTRGDVLSEAWKAWKGKPVQHESDPDIERLREFKKIGEPKRVSALLENILVFWEGARGKLAGGKRKRA